MRDPNYRKKKAKDLYECGRGHRTIVPEGKPVRDNCMCGSENELIVSGERKPHEKLD